MIKSNLNEYGLAAGLLLLLMAVAHAVYGEAVVFNDLQFMAFDRALFTTIYMPWHQMSLVLVICALGLIISSVRSGHKSIQTFVLLLVLSNLGILSYALLRGAPFASANTLLIFQVWPQFFFFVVLVLLIVLGLRKKENPH